MPNKMSRMVAKINALPGPLRVPALTKAMAAVVPFIGTAHVRMEELTEERVVASVRNRRAVQNHIKGVHATVMALLAETVTGLLVGMNLPDDKIPLIKTLKVDYINRSQGDMRAVATITPEQAQLLHDEERGNFPVTVVVSDESDEPPIECEMIWAWVTKKH